MSTLWAELRFMLDRGAGLLRRGLTSLRTRGWRVSWQRALIHFRPLPRAQRPKIYLPGALAFAPFSVPADAHPRASVVIPVFDQCSYTLICLRALAAHPPQSGIEIIVVDDGSSDHTPGFLPQVSGLRYHRRTSNGGFIAACNEGATLARGEYLVFLNNDTVPQPGWLDALLATFDQHPRTGLAGSQLLYPDGRLQEAGGLVFADGSGWNYGRFSAPDAPRHAYVREADYCSGAAIAIRRELFARLGGFDTRYSPAYFEDTDLAFAVRQAGLGVIYQPASRVVHFEGTTAGTDTGRGAKAYQVRNREVFSDKWREQLSGHFPAGTPPEDVALRPCRTSVLIIDALTPRPDRDSASLRLVNLMRLLREEGAHVVFLPTDRRHDGAYTECLQQLGVEVWHAPYASRPSSWLREHGRRFSTVLVCRHYVMREMLPLLRRHAPQARLVFDSVDLHYLRERRGAELTGDAAAARGAAKTRTLELDVIARSDVTLVVSQAERELLARDAPHAPVEVVSNLHRAAGHGLPFAQRHDLVFVGGFRHPPNEDAMRWFLGEVWPLIRAHQATLQLHCIGGDVTAPLRALAAQPGVIVHGHVPDLQPYMDGVRVAVAPLRYGAGVKGKVNLSMAHGQPVVATGCAIEGMHLTPGADVLIADNPQQFADAVLTAYHDEGLWQRLSDGGLANVQRHFSPEAAREVVRRVLVEHRPGDGVVQQRVP